MDTRLPLRKVIAAVLLCGSAESAVAAEPFDLAAVLTVRGMDCPAESALAVLAISKIPGVKTVSVNYKAGTLSVVPKSKAFPSPLAIWEAAETARLEPVRLTTILGTYDSKPLR